MAAQRAVYKRALAEVAPGAGEVAGIVLCAAACKVAVYKCKAVFLRKRMGGRGNKAQAPPVVKRDNFAVFKIPLAAAENKIDAAADFAVFKQADVRAFAIELLLRNEAAVAHHKVVGEGGEEDRVLRGDKFAAACPEIFAVHRKRDALPDLFGRGIGILHGQVFKFYPVARHAQRVGAEGVVFLPVRVNFAGVVVKSDYRLSAAIADEGHAVFRKHGFPAVDALAQKHGFAAF